MVSIEDWVVCNQERVMMACVRYFFLNFAAFSEYLNFTISWYIIRTQLEKFSFGRKISFTLNQNNNIIIDHQTICLICFVLEIILIVIIMVIDSNVGTRCCTQINEIP